MTRKRYIVEHYVLVSIVILVCCFITMLTTLRSVVYAQSLRTINKPLVALSRTPPAIPSEIVTSVDASSALAAEAVLQGEIDTAREIIRENTASVQAIQTEVQDLRDAYHDILGGAKILGLILLVLNIVAILAKSRLFSQNQPQEITQCKHCGAECVVCNPEPKRSNKTLNI